MIGKGKSKTILISSTTKSKFIFIHNYKVAGTSLRQSFAAHINTSEWLINNLLYYLGIKKIGKYIGVKKHARALDVKSALGEDYKKYFVFGLVRNPWDWEVSRYHYQLKNTKHFRHKFVKDLKSFEDYIRWRDTHNRTQLSFFADDSGELLVDYIGKIEELDKFYATLESKLGVKLSKYELNKSRESNEYRQFYNDETKEVVERIYKQDIDTFGYTF
ncbi:MAG: hypothetical protein ABJF11_07575 [Reichenbachiella sp.]|uniref:hypothetical protein n=1 Tax=Reichenbachiella sp. TaxID=2184521 RepID=UPI0032663A37